VLRRQHDDEAPAEQGCGPSASPVIDAPPSSTGSSSSRYEVIDGAVGDHLDNERAILEPLSPNETRHLERLLRKLERGLSGRPGSDD
jgi:hypothetical protein